MMPSTAVKGSKLPVRVLVIGASVTSELLHLPVLAELKAQGEIELTLICDLQAARAEVVRQTFGFKEACGDAVLALARGDIDAVYIFGSAQLHHQYGLMALAAGKHLFVEKPVAPTYAQACELAKAARATGLIAVGGHNRRFYRSLDQARARAGKAGWRFAEAVFHKSEFGKPPPFGARSWLTANGIHALDALVWMMGGLPEEVHALADRASVYSALMRWPGGAQGVFLCDNASGARREDYVFHGPGETIAITESGVTVSRDGVSATTKLASAGDGFAAEHAAFIDAIRTGDEPRHSLAALAPSLFLAELIEDGFSGAVLPPRIEAPVQAPGRALGGGLVLVCAAGALQPALGRRLAGHRLVSLEDVMTSPGAWPEIGAAILGRGSGPLPAAALDKLPRLAVVGIMGLSLARHEPEALLARGITIVNSSQAYAGTVAEFALGLAILGRRRAFLSHERMRRGGWGSAAQTRSLGRLARGALRPLRPLLKATGLERGALRAWSKARPAMDGAAANAPGGPSDLKGATVGLIGWGANARAFALRLIQAGARVMVYSENGADAEIAAAGAHRVTLGEALAAEIVSLHRGLTPKTLHFLGAAELDKLRPGALLINVARGALIEPGALLARLKRGDIFACLDAFETEPPAAADPLRRLPNVFLTSHIAGGSRAMHAAAAEEVVGKVADILAGASVEAITADRLGAMT